MVVLAETRFVEYQLCWIRQVDWQDLLGYSLLTFLVRMYFTSLSVLPTLYSHFKSLQFGNSAHFSDVCSNRDPFHPITNIVINDLGTTQFLDENLATAQNFCFTGKNIFDKVAAYLDATTKLQTAFFEKITTATTLELRIIGIQIIVRLLL